MTVRDFLSVMQTSRHNIYPLIRISDYGDSEVDGEFGYVDEVLAMDDEYAFLLDAKVEHVDFSESVGGELYIEIEVNT